MLNLIRADIYRLVQGKLFWVTTGLFSIFCFLAGTGKFSPTLRETVGKNQFVQAGQILSGAQAPFTLMASPEFMVYFLLPILIALASTDFSSGALRNTLARGISRVRFYFSKLLLAWGIGLVFGLLQAGLSLVSGTAVLGFGQTVDAAYALRLFEVFSLQFLLLMAVISLGIGLIFITRKTAVVTAIYLLLFTVVQFAISILALFSSTFASLRQFELINCLKQAVLIPGLASPDIARLALVGAAYVIVMAALGLLSFQRSDLQ